MHACRGGLGGSPTFADFLSYLLSFVQGRELVAHTETVYGTFRVDPKTLETLGR